MCSPYQFQSYRESFPFSTGEKVATCICRLGESKKGQDLGNLFKIKKGKFMTENNGKSKYSLTTSSFSAELSLLPNFRFAEIVIASFTLNIG